MPFLNGVPARCQGRRRPPRDFLASKMNSQLIFHLHLTRGITALLVQQALAVTSVGFVCWDCIPLPNIAVGTFALVPVDVICWVYQSWCWGEPELGQLDVFSLGSESWAKGQKMVCQHLEETINSFLLTWNLSAAPVPVPPLSEYLDFPLILSVIHMFPLKSVSGWSIQNKFLLIECWGT